MARRRKVPGWGHGRSLALETRLVPVDEFERTQSPVEKALRVTLDGGKLHGRLGVSAWIRAVVSTKGIDGIKVERILPDGRLTQQTGLITKEMLDVHEDLESWLISLGAHRGRPPYRFSIKAIAHDTWIGPAKIVSLGSPDFDAPAGSPGGLEELDRVLADNVRRQSAIAFARQLEESNTERQGDDDMKAGDLAEIMKAVAELRGGSNDQAMTLMMEQIRLERTKVEALMAERKSTNPLEAISTLGPLAAPALTALVAFLDKKLTPGFVSRLVAGLTRPSTPVTVESSGPGIADVLKGIVDTLGPALQPLIARLVQMMPVSVSTTPSPPTALPSGGAMERMETSQEVRDYLIAALTERRFQDAYAVMKTDESLIPWLSTVEPGVDPRAYWFKLRTLDDRLPAMQGVALEFIAFIQEAIVKYLEAMKSDAEREARESQRDGSNPIVVKP